MVLDPDSYVITHYAIALSAPTVFLNRVQLLHCSRKP